MRNRYSAFLRISIGMLTALCLASCRTEELTLSGEFKAQLLDAASHKPVVGAVVTVWSDNSPSVIARQISDDTGMVSVAALKGSVPVSFPLEMGFTATAKVEAPGYRPMTLGSSRDRAYFQYSNRKGPTAELLLLQN